MIRLKRGHGRGASTAKPLAGAPLPEAIDGQPWRVTAGMPEVDLAAHTMRVPLGTDAFAAYAQAHEMAHVAFTPPDAVARSHELLTERYGIDTAKVVDAEGFARLVNAVEDARINAMLARLDVVPPKVKAIPPSLLRTIETAPLAEQLTVLASTLNTPDYTAVEKACKFTPNMLRQVRSCLKPVKKHRRRIWGKVGNSYPFSLTTNSIVSLSSLLVNEAARKELDEALAPSDGSPSPGEGKPGSSAPGAASPSEVRDGLDALGSIGSLSDEAIRAAAELVRERTAGEHSAERIEYVLDADTGDTVKWCRMPITRLPLSERLPIRIRMPRNIASDVGAVPYAMHRLTSDQRCFRQKRRLPGGSVLIDASGSMSLSNADLNALLEAMPAAVVATYCGEDEGVNGSLWIIAQNGRRAARTARLSDSYGGNGCDYPALLWLAEQDEPRFWICDGYVIPGEGSSRRAAVAQCMALARSARILRIDTPDALSERFGRRPARLG